VYRYYKHPPYKKGHFGHAKRVESIDFAFVADVDRPEKRFHSPAAD
jgi:hypothetical protein